jgi:glycosyltransferase involved in cell wall biosynthesis
LIPGLQRHPRPWIGFSGELRFKKGLTLLQELAESLAREERGTLFIVGGVREEERERMGRWRRSEPRAAPRLVELPYLRDHAQLLAHYQAMDLFVFPSLWEGLPNAMLEAMACARPVLATRAGGIVDVIEDGRSGVLLGLDELDRLGQAVHRLLGMDRAEREALGQEARRRVCQAFAPAAERDALLGLYRELCGPEEP